MLNITMLVDIVSEKKTDFLFENSFSHYVFFYKNDSLSFHEII